MLCISARVLLFFACALATLLILSQTSHERHQQAPNQGEEDQRSQQHKKREDQHHMHRRRGVGLGDTAASSAGMSLRRVLSLRGCSRLFIDGGAHLGESLRAFESGRFFTCAMGAPDRVYKREWTLLTKAQRSAAMQPLMHPDEWCVRAFEPVPALLPRLQEDAAALRERGRDVRVIGAALSNVTAANTALRLVRYSDAFDGLTVTKLDFADVHVEGPRVSSLAWIHAASVGVTDMLRHALHFNPKITIAMRLDIEGAEWSIMRMLADEPELLCQIDYLFVEFHSTATAAQREWLPNYGIAADAFEQIKARVHAAMERPQCRLQLYWRSFWASCGDLQRFEWRDSAQVRGAARG